jgi:hypothetical protein
MFSLVLAPILTYLLLFITHLNLYLATCGRMRTCHPQSPAPASRISAESSVQPLQPPAISGKRTTEQNAALLEVKYPRANPGHTDLVLRIREADPDPYLFKTKQNMFQKL